MKTSRFRAFGALVMAAVIGLAAGAASAAALVAVALPDSVLRVAHAAGQRLNAAVFGYMQRSGLVLSLDRVPTPADFNARRVTSADSSEVLRQTLFDYLLYPAAGQQSFVFFSQGIGQGVTSSPGATVGSAKTQFDTNMQLNSALPSGMQYLAESIELDFIPGSSATAQTFAPATLTTSATGLISASNVSGLNDRNLVWNTGLLELKILQKTQLLEGPLRLFPPKTWMELDAAVATTTTTTNYWTSNLRLSGRPYYLEPEISLQPAVNFTVTVSTPVAQALPSTFNGRMGVRFDGYLMRAAQ